MPNWKKVVTSGSAPALNGLTADGNVRITGSLSVSGSIKIEMPSGSAFEILEGDESQQGRLLFNYDDGDPTLTVASRQSTAKIEVRADQSSNKLTLDEDGQIYVNGTSIDGIKIEGDNIHSVGTNANRLDLGKSLRPWGDVYLAADKGVIIDGGTSSEFLKADGSVDSNTYSTATGVENNADVTDATNVAAAGALMASNNLSDLSSAGDARDNLGLGSVATTAASAYLAVSNNLSDVSNAATARTNLGAAKIGANSDITSLSGLTTALSVAQGGTGLTELGSASQILQVNSDADALEFTSTLRAGNGLLATPSISFQSDQNTGIYSVAADTLGIAAGASLISTFSTTGLQLTAPLLSSDGTNGAPGISFSGDTNTGFYRSGADELSITIGGSQIGYFNSNGLQVTVSGQTSQFSGHLQAHCLGIGGTPSTTSGEIWAYGDVVANKSSDIRLKKYIKNIKNPLDKLSKINGVTFEWKKTDDKMKREVHSHEGHDIGVIAQEVEEVLPEIVATRDNGYKAVYYEKLVPLLIEAVKELKAEVDELKKSK